MKTTNFEDKIDSIPMCLQSFIYAPIDKDGALLVQLDRVAPAEHGGKHAVAIRAERAERGRKQLPADVQAHLVGAAEKHGLVMRVAATADSAIHTTSISSIAASAGFG